MLLIFIAINLIASPVFDLLMSAGPWGRTGFIWIYDVKQALNFLSLIPFLVFVGTAKQYFAGEQTKTNQRTPEELTKGPVWDTDLDKSQIKQISTKRNLAFVIDSLPAMAALLGSIYLPWTLANSNFATGFATLLSIGLFVFSIAAIAYALLKDSFDGQSVGKRMLDCRVVSAETGQPADVAASLVRNLIFLLPLMVPVELLVSKIRGDGKRLGDLWAQTRVVAGPPQWIDGILITREEPQKKHALDD